MKATVTPSSASPGAQVEVRADGCDGTTGSASSGAFEYDAELTGRDGDKYSLNGTTKIKYGVSGSYSVTITCDGHPHQGAGTVQVIRNNPAPVSPVRAGGGGTAHLAESQLAQSRLAGPAASAEAREAGPGTRHAVIGLVLAGVAAVAVAFRSVRRRRSE
ncbi:hypothetical protein [Streptomyces sp. NPDC059009]|uniref:hypothetical protein n=1 Tax=Streptomyces sp. NPDC059009 TaxID=3346694 RepID=UPI0036C291C5